MKASTHATECTAETVTVLSVSPVPADHVALKRLFAGFAPGDGRPSRWQVSARGNLSLALKALRHFPYPAVLCERDLPDGDWKDLLEHTKRLSNPPLVIVTSRHADDYLWTEALNLGAHDVLAKPYEPSEARRVVSLACLLWLREWPNLVRTTPFRQPRARFQLADCCT